MGICFLYNFLKKQLKKIVNMVYYSLRTNIIIEKEVQTGGSIKYREVLFFLQVVDNDYH